jgi:hypothetical protein
MTFSGALFAAIDRNVDAMIKAHGLSHLSREEAFRVLDDPDSVGIDRWENNFNEYGQHFSNRRSCLSPSVCRGPPGSSGTTTVRFLI